MAKAAYVDLMVYGKRIIFYHERENGMEEIETLIPRAYQVVKEKRDLPPAWVKTARVEGSGYEAEVVFELADPYDRKTPLSDFRIRAVSLYYIYFERFFRG